MSMAVPTIITSTMIITISMMGLLRNGSSMPTTLPGKSATVMSQAETMAAATRNITTAGGLGRRFEDAVQLRELQATIDDRGDEQCVDRGDHAGFGRSEHPSLRRPTRMMTGSISAQPQRPRRGKQFAQMVCAAAALCLHCEATIAPGEPQRERPSAGRARCRP